MGNRRPLPGRRHLAFNLVPPGSGSQRFAGRIRYSNPQPPGQYELASHDRLDSTGASGCVVVFNSTTGRLNANNARINRYDPKADERRGNVAYLQAAKSLISPANDWKVRAAE